MSTSKIWLIVWCNHDKSFSLIKESDAVYDEEALEVGDNITFIYSGREYVGELVEFGGCVMCLVPVEDDADYDQLIKKLNYLNSTKNKKNRDSFHDDLPRKTRGKGGFQEAVDSLKSKHRRTKVTADSKPCSSKQVLKNAHTKRPVVKQSDMIDNSSSSDVESLSTSPESSPISEALSKQHQKEVKQINRKVAAQGKAGVISLLKKNSKALKNHLDDKNNNDQSQVDDVNISFGQRAKCGVAKSNQHLPSIPVFVDSDEESPTVEVEETHQNKPKRHKASRKKEVEPRQEVNCVSSAGEEDKLIEADMHQPDTKFMRRHTKDDPDVVEIRGLSKLLSSKSFYVSNKALQVARMASNASIFAKHLFVAAFSDEALLTCSVSGGQYRAAGRANIRQKPALDADILAVIIEAAIRRQETKKWKPDLSQRELMNRLRQKLVDIRPRLQNAMSRKNVPQSDEDM